ncbi:unnamed protein product [Phyllotreta striolata]|uniref:Glucose-methanol-choline oxidoreductase N-terminal domain-containing protein n=1 Tax=Phyllotreta striolata TaxID=444603 RepID=A0A9N9TTA6_PHYSR|nr:unnamed protein product [Phyllotreta striolata]
MTGNPIFTFVWCGIFASLQPVQSFIMPNRLNNFNDVKINETFDFIVIGSGPSGSVIANRLSEVPEWKVLLIEAGGIALPIVEAPGICSAFQFTNYDWGYRTQQQDGFCSGCINKTLKYAHGKALGGSTIINFMIHVRGNRRDYDRWEAMGNPGWSYEEVLPYFLKSEDAHLDKSDPGYHNSGGYLSVTDVPYRTKLVDYVVQAAQEAGYPYVDYNGKEQMGVSYVQAHLRNGRRCSADKAFLRPVMDRKNLKILTNSRVVKILIDPVTKETYGVKFAKRKKYYYAFAKKEVISSAGGLNSPQLLMLSGVGPKDHLEELDIPVLADLPVGKKMYDHSTFLGILFEINQKIVFVYDEVITSIKEITDFAVLGKGQITSIGGVEALLYFKSNVSTDPDPLYPDMEFIVLGASISADNGVIMRKMFNIPIETYNKIWKKYETTPAYQIMPMLVHPRSVGYIKLKSKNPFHWPKSYANFFSDPENHDIKTYIAAIREMQRLNRTPTMRKLGATLITIPIPGE